MSDEIDLESLERCVKEALKIVDSVRVPIEGDGTNKEQASKEMERIRSYFAWRGYKVLKTAEIQGQEGYYDSLFTYELNITRVREASLKKQPEDLLIERI